MNVYLLQHLGFALEVRQGFENDVVLVQLCIQIVDLALAECVVERVVDGGGRDAQTRCGDPVDHQRYGEPSVLPVGSHVGQLRELLELGYETVGP